jgi:hypothetical protein
LLVVLLGWIRPTRRPPIQPLADAKSASTLTS